MSSSVSRVAMGLALLLLAAAGLVEQAAGQTAAATWQAPSLYHKWDYLLSVTFTKATEGIQIYAIDGFDNTAASVAAIRASNGGAGYPVCYFSAGTFEDWRPDAGSFLASDKGLALGDWPGENWLDIRSANVRAIMAKRMQMCKDKGFLAVDPDNVDGYTQRSGFPLTAADQIAYNTWLADTAHSLGLAVGLKNDIAQVAELAPKFDFFVNEQCMQYSECGLYAPAKAAGKPVLNVEYTTTNFNLACPSQATYGMRTILKKLALDAYRVECANDPFPPPAPPSPSPPPSPSLPPPSPGPWWKPAAADLQRFQYQLSVVFDPARHFVDGVTVYGIDGFDTPAAAVDAIKARGAVPICYISAGTWESWRPDAGLFKSTDKGKAVGGWAKEKYLNIKSANVRAIMAKRMQMCKDKGFLAVDPDNVDTYTATNSGFKFTAADQIAYNAYLADTAHSLGLAVGLKNDVAQISDLGARFDFFVNEQCAYFKECGLYAPAKAANKPVWSVEYQDAAFSAACACQATYGVLSIRKNTSLDAYRRECASPTSTCAAPLSADGGGGGGGGGGSGGKKKAKTAAASYARSRASRTAAATAAAAPTEPVALLRSNRARREAAASGL